MDEAPPVSGPDAPRVPSKTIIRVTGGRQTTAIYDVAGTAGGRCASFTMPVPPARSVISTWLAAPDVRVQTSALRPTAVPRWGGWGYIREINLEVCMLLALAVILLILAVVGGIAIHPLLFLIALLAVLALLASRTGRF